MDNHCLLLPSHPSQSCLDPLGITDEDSPSSWNVITALIHNFQQSGSTIHSLPNLIEDISVSLFGKSVNTEFLTTFLRTTYPASNDNQPGQILNKILGNALVLPDLFPSHTLPYLHLSNHIELTHSQIKSLLAHQILNTLNPPINNNWGCTFTAWYSAPQPLAFAVTGYLRTLFAYFLLPFDDSELVTYSYVTLPRPEYSLEVTSWRNETAFPLDQSLIIEPMNNNSLEFPHPEIPCTLVASNSYPGFGPACTQEELVTGSCPPLLPLGALFIVPPVSPDAAIICSGTLPISHWIGIGRDARAVGANTSVAHRTFVFLDASELDSSSPGQSTIVDLEPNIFFRDLHKAYTGLSALSKLGITRISSPLWGAGAFGGDPVIKTIILSMAAARAGLQIHISVDRQRRYEVENNPFVSALDMKDRILIHDLERLKAVGRDWSFAEIMRRGGLDSMGGGH